jgi:hypothetical protein
MSSTDIVIEGGYPGGWLDTLTNFEFPSSVAVFTFDLSWTGDSQNGTSVPFSDTPIVTITGQGGGIQTGILSGGTQMLNAAIAVAAFPPFAKQDTSSIPIPKFFDYTTCTFLYGLRGSAYPRGAAVTSGASGAECFAAAVAQISSGLMSEFGWDYETTIHNMVGVAPLFDFYILLGLIDSTPVAPPGRNPAEPQPPIGLYDPNAVTVLRGGGNNTVLQDWRNSALVIPISPFKGPGKTVSISMNLKAPPQGNTLTWAAGCATYKKPPKGWKKSPPSGWNIGPETYPTYATYPWHRTQGYDLPLLGQPNGSTDDKEIHSNSGGTAGSPPGPRSIRFTIDAKSLGITPSG